MSNYHGRLFKTANLRLSSNVDVWPDEIYRYLSQTHPYLINYLQGDIDWSEEPIDEELGNAIGSVTALVGETPLIIPIIIRDYELKPIDMYRRQDGEMDLLSPNVVMENISPLTVGVGQRIDPHLENPSGIINKISGYTEFEEDCERIMNLVEQDFPKLAASCERLREKTGGGSAPYDAMVMAYASGTYKLGFFRKGHRTGEFILDAGTVYADPESKLAQAGRTAKRDGEVVMVARDNQRVALNAVNPYHIDVDSFDGGLSMMTADGRAILGKLASAKHFTGTERRVFVSDGVFYDAPEKVASAMNPFGEDVRLSFENMQKVATTALKRDDVGFFRVGEDLYGPVKVASNFTSPSGERALSVHTEYGPAELVLSKRAMKCLPAGRGRFLMPESAEFFPMERLTPTRLTPMDVLREKVAADGEASFTISYSDNSGFSLAVDDLSHDGLSRGETIACLTSLGLSKTSSLDCIREAETHTHRKSAFYGIEHPSAEHRGEAAIHPANRLQVERFIERVIDLRPAINKLASDVDSIDLQDDLNAVNLMNQYNAARYADAIDELETSKAAVANILHGIRVGEVESIDEQAAKDALMALDQIIRGLNDISASQQ